MNGKHRVDPCDLEDAQDARVRRDDVHPALRPGGCCAHERPYARRVEERAARELDDDGCSRRGVGDRLLEARRAGEVELPEDVQHRRTGRRRLQPYGKIARRGHAGRV